MAYLDALLGFDTRTEKQKEQTKERSREYKNKLDELGITDIRERLERVRSYLFLTRVRESRSPIVIDVRGKLGRAKTGSINMLHGAEILVEKYKLPSREARKIFAEWASFSH